MPMSKGPNGHGGWSYRPEAITASFEKCTEMLAACVTGCGNLLLNIGPMADGSIRPSELENLKQFSPWIETYGESIYGTKGGPYISGQWGGSNMKGDSLYLHIFQWNDGVLKLPALPREVLHWEELSGELIDVKQTEDSLTISLKDEKQNNLHSVVKLSLKPGAPIPLIPVEGEKNLEQHGALENPMSSDE